MTKIAIGEAFEAVIQTMSDYVSEVENEVFEVFEEFHQVAVIDNPWEILYKTAKSLESTYNEQVLGQVKNEINKWAESEGSYVSLTNRFKMGEDAEAEAQRQQDEIVDEINNIQVISRISDAQPNFLNTEFELNSVKSKLEEISTQAQKLIEIVEEKNEHLKNLSEENASVKTIVNVGITYGDSIANFVTKVTEKISAFLSEQIDSMEQSNEAALDDAKQAAEEFNQYIDDILSYMDSNLDDIFG